MKCFWSLPRQCPWLVEKRISVKDASGEVLVWESCAHHVVNANQDALTWIYDNGHGSLHTMTYAQSGRGKQRPPAPFRPHLAITDEQLHRDMILAQQSVEPRITMSAYIIRAIRAYVYGKEGN